MFLVQATASLRAGLCAVLLPRRPPRQLVGARAASGDAASSSNDGDAPLGDTLGSPAFKGFGARPQPAVGKKISSSDALQSSLSDLSQREGRVAQSNNIILGDSESEEKWRELDAQVNEYPGFRTFKAIGDGGESFVAAMREAVESVAGPLHEECVATRLSSGGNYISVTLGPVPVQTPDQVLAIYENMRADPRMRFFF